MEGWETVGKGRQEGKGTKGKGGMIGEGKEEKEKRRKGERWERAGKGRTTEWVKFGMDTSTRLYSEIEVKFSVLGDHTVTPHR